MRNARKPDGRVELVGGQFGGARQPQRPGTEPPGLLDDCLDEALGHPPAAAGWVRGDLVDRGGVVPTLVESDEPGDGTSEVAINAAIAMIAAAKPANEIEAALEVVDRDRQLSEPEQRP